MKFGKLSSKLTFLKIKKSRFKKRDFLVRITGIEPA